MATLRGERVDLMDTHEFEEALAQLPSITAVRVATDDHSKIDVHVLASPATATTQVVRELQTEALTKFGIILDGNAISVIQISPTSNTTDDARSAARPADENPPGRRGHGGSDSRVESRKG